MPGSKTRLLQNLWQNLGDDRPFPFTPLSWPISSELGGTYRRAYEVLQTLPTRTPPRADSLSKVLEARYDQRMHNFEVCQLSSGLLAPCANPWEPPFPLNAETPEWRSFLLNVRAEQWWFGAMYGVPDSVPC